jgi:hypothetical protein
MQHHRSRLDSEGLHSNKYRLNKLSNERMFAVQFHDLVPLLQRFQPSNRPKEARAKRGGVSTT